MGVVQEILNVCLLPFYFSKIMVFSHLVDPLKSAQGCINGLRLDRHCFVHMLISLRSGFSFLHFHGDIVLSALWGFCGHGILVLLH